MPGHYAQAQPTAPADSIGKIEKVVGDVTVVRNGVSVALHVGDAVFKSDVVQTGANSSCGISFPDGTALNLVANTRMALNDYAFDANSNSNGALFTLVEGTFAFVAGKVAHQGDMKIATPVATMGIRGTTGVVQEQPNPPATITATAADHTYSFAVVPDIGTGVTGMWDVFLTDANGIIQRDANGNPIVLVTVSQSGYVTYVTPQGVGQAPLVTTEPVTNSQYAFEQEMLHQLFLTLNPSNLNGNNNNGSSTQPPPFNLPNPIPQLFEDTGKPFTINFTNGSTTPTPTIIDVSGPTGPLTVVIWIANSDGPWSASQNWLGGITPSSPQEVVIPGHKVTTDGADLAAGLVVNNTNSGPGILNIASGTSLTIYDFIHGNGTIQLNASGSDPTLYIHGAVPLVGGGTINMLGPAGQDFILGVPGSGAGLVNIDYTIEGTGTIGGGDGNLTFQNFGTVNANNGLLTINTGNQVYNDGLMEATVDPLAVTVGTLAIKDSLVNAGTVQADGTGAAVTLSGATFDNLYSVVAENGGSVTFTGVAVTNEAVSASDPAGGTINATGGGTITFDSGSLANAGTIQATDQGTVTFQDINVTNVGGTIEAVGSNATVQLDDATISHGTMETSDGGLIETAGGNGTFLDVTIAGGEMLVNPDTLLTLNGTTTFEGLVTLEGGAITNNGLIDITGNSVINDNAAVTGGQIKVENGATLALDDATLKNVTVSLANSSGTVLSFEPSAINNFGQVVGTSSDINGNLEGVLYSNGTSTTFSDPSGVGTLALALNDSGQVVGSYYIGTAPFTHPGGPLANEDEDGFIYSNGTFTTLHDPSAAHGTVYWGTGGTRAFAINNSGQVVGVYIDANETPHGFLYNNGTYTALDDPSAGTGAGQGTQATGINNGGQIIGGYVDANGNDHGFIYSNGAYTTLDDPLAGSGPNQGTFVSAINNAGQVVGNYIDANGNDQGFLYSNGTYTTLDDPFGVTTYAFGLNDVGQVVGNYLDANGFGHAFIYSDGKYTTVDDGLSVQLLGINNAGQILVRDDSGGLIDDLPATLQVDSGHSLNLDHSSVLGGTIENAGNVVVTNGASVLHGDSVTNAGTMTVEAGASLTLEGDTTLINEAGGLIKADGGTVAIELDTDTNVNSGTIEAVNGGEVDFYINVQGGSNHGLITAGAGGTVHFFDTHGGGGDSGGGGQGGNYGTMEATDGGVLIFEGGLDNFDLVEAFNGGLVYLNNGIKNHAGTVESSGSGSQISIANGGDSENADTIIAENDGVISLASVVLTNDAGAMIEATSGGSISWITGGIDNSGTFDADGGSITFGGSIGITNEAGGIFEAANGGSITFGTSGIGSVTNAAGGLIEALSGGTITFDSTLNGGTNAGVIEAGAGGTIIIDGFEGGNALFNGGGTIEAIGAGAKVELAGVDIMGGTLATSSDGVIESVSSTTSTLSGVTIADGSFLQTDSGAFLDLEGTTTLDGTVTFEGSGTFVLDPGPASIVGRSGGGTLDNESTIQGAGQIGAGDGELTFDNQSGGVVNANQTGKTLTIDTDNAAANAGTLEATNGGTLQVDDAVNNSNMIEALNNGAIVLAGGGSNSGTITATGGGSITIDNDNNTSVFNSNEIQAGSGGTITIDNTSDSGIWNSGTLEALAGGTLDINDVNDLLLKNAGTLDADGGTINIIHNHSSAINLGTNEAIDGGTINITNINDNGVSGGGNAGLQKADGGTINIHGGASNLGTGTMEAINGGTFDIVSGGLSNASGGTAEAGSGGTFTINGGVDNAGTIEADACGTINITIDEPHRQLEFRPGHGRLRRNDQHQHDAHDSITSATQARSKANGGTINITHDDVSILGDNTAEAINGGTIIITSVDNRSGGGNAGTEDADGGIIVSNGGLSNLSGGLAEAIDCGTFDVIGGVSNASGGTVKAASGGTFDITVDNTGNMTSGVSNLGTIEADCATLCINIDDSTNNNSGGISNSGTIKADHPERSGSRCRHHRREQPGRHRQYRHHRVRLRHAQHQHRRQRRRRQHRHQQFQDHSGRRRDAQHQR